LVARARTIGDHMLERLTAMQRATAGVGDVRGRGAMVAIELVADDGSPDAERAKQICAACHQQGVIVLTAGTLGNVVRLLPPLVLDDALLVEGLDALDAAVRA
ncbi:MAG: aminotransferase class III-fold pyridoxal phosphate-dependent enzyme, partial [Actinomycetota bacterium]